MRGTLATALACLIVLHRPDGAEIAIDTRQIAVVEPVETRHHYVAGTHTLVHVTGAARAVATYEQPHEVEYLMKTCVDRER